MVESVTDFVDEGEAAAAAPVQSVNGETGDINLPGGAETLPSTIASSSRGAVAVDASVELFIEDADPRGEAFLEFIMSVPSLADALASDPFIMFVINNEEVFEDRLSEPTPEDFDQAYTSLTGPVAEVVAWIETLLADYDAGQTELENLMDIGPIADEIGDSAAAMAVINKGDELTDIQDYRV